MAETTVYRTKPSNETSTKGQTAFYRNVILPSKALKEKQKLPLNQIKNTAAAYEKQTTLRKEDTEKFRSSLERQLSIDMLRHGYHNSFRELCAILAWQKEDRERLGAEHPLHRRPLLDAESDKLRYLCQYLNKAEEAERRSQFSNMYHNYLELASYFLKSDDRWLSDYFYEKSLTVAQTHSQFDPQLAAEAYLNVGLAYERRSDLVKALNSFIKYYQLSEDNEHLKTDASIQLTRLYMKLAQRRTDNQSLQYVNKAYEASIQTGDKKVENETSYKLGQAFLEHGDVDSALKYLHKYYDYCQEVNNDEGFGQASEALAICYQKKSNIEKSTEYLTKYLQKVSDKEGDMQYARACSALGFIHITLSQYDSAIQSLSKAYSISLANSHADLDRNRVLFGIAHGMKLRPAFNDHVDRMHTKELLQWKCTRHESFITKPKP
ncbi:unnamed protein product [Adineta steineri]|uniref:Tetratricopeptide repeat protein 29 n=1 Tax=Adineta steineri TaxID=433720 RepID=A0A814NLN9_9BILA|nr:unnamed protein product [Adineta steineri]CAF1079622.1 unnamed protein product [Adineta steineri]CAF1094004.1 unnamed protein product [Adineta steineri]